MEETIATAVTEATTAATEVIEVTTPENIETLKLILTETMEISEFLRYLSGFGLFFVIVALCYFGYKFLRIFF